MNSRQKKTLSHKPTWDAERARYQWHLKPPFKGKFDRSHWWVKAKDITPVAALYELVRRHPLVGERVRRVEGSDRFPTAIICLGDIGLKSWPQLTPGQQNHWKTFSSNLKGVDCRNTEEKCFSVTWQGDGDPLHQAVKLCRGKSLPTAAELEAGIARRAIEAHHQGYVLFAVAPDLGGDEAGKLLYRQYSEFRSWKDSVNGTGKQRARNENWLPIIAEFEREATNKKTDLTRKPEVFKRYKRVMDGIDFLGR